MMEGRNIASAIRSVLALLFMFCFSGLYGLDFLFLWDSFSLFMNPLNAVRSRIEMSMKKFQFSMYCTSNSIRFSIEVSPR